MALAFSHTSAFRITSDAGRRDVLVLPRSLLLRVAISPPPSHYPCRLPLPMVLMSWLHSGPETTACAGGLRGLVCCAAPMPCSTLLAGDAVLLACPCSHTLPFGRPLCCTSLLIFCVSCGAHPLSTLDVAPLFLNLMSMASPSGGANETTVLFSVGSEVTRASQIAPVLPPTVP